MELAHKKYMENHRNDNSDSNDTEDIFGTWHFDCPESADIWDEDQEQTIVWKIHRPDGKDKCLWVVFHQVCVEGIISIGWVDNPDNGQIFGKELRFTWSGCETGENYHNVGHGVITFSSFTECAGYIVCSDISSEKWEFTGRKVSNQVSNIPVERCRKLYQQIPHHPKAPWNWY